MPPPRVCGTYLARVKLNVHSRKSNREERSTRFDPHLGKNPPRIHTPTLPQSTVTRTRTTATGARTSRQHSDVRALWHHGQQTGGGGGDGNEQSVCGCGCWCARAREEDTHRKRERRRGRQKQRQTETEADRGWVGVGSTTTTPTPTPKMYPLPHTGSPNPQVTVKPFQTLQGKQPSPTTGQKES